MLRTLAAGASVCSIYMFKAGSYQVGGKIIGIVPFVATPLKGRLGVFSQ